MLPEKLANLILIAGTAVMGFLSTDEDDVHEEGCEPVRHSNVSCFRGYLGARMQQKRGKWRPRGMS
jgi:hypothetical protein